MVCTPHRLQCKMAHLPKYKFPIHATWNVQMQLKSTVMLGQKCPIELLVGLRFPLSSQCKIWLKPNAEQSFLYGNHVLKSGLGRITENTGQYQGVVMYSMNDLPLVSKREGGRGREGGEREGGREGQYQGVVMYSMNDLPLVRGTERGRREGM